MNRLAKELRDRNITYSANEQMIWLGAEHDEDAYLVSIDRDFLITVVYSAVLDPVLRIYDRRTLKAIGEQQLYPERMFGDNSRTWFSFGYTEG